MLQNLYYFMPYRPLQKRYALLMHLVVVPFVSHAQVATELDFYNFQLVLHQAHRHTD